ncbi:MAG: VWA domain-containing protein [Pseudomonadota bacterium]
MRFGNPEYFWLLWLIPLSAIFMFIAYKLKIKTILRLFDEEMLEKLSLSRNNGRKFFKVILVLLCLAMLVVCLVRPRWGFEWKEVKRVGIDLVIAIDVSNSMLAQDVKPNRMEWAKRKIIDLINMLQGDRVGLVAFAGLAFLQCPLTLDYNALDMFLDSIDTDLIPVQGTSLTSAIKVATEAFDKSVKRQKAIILITDGEDHEKDAEKEALIAKTSGIKIFTIGIGASQGAPIPLPSGGFRKDESGNLILTKLDEVSLQKIAIQTGGTYIRSTAGDLDLTQVYKKNIRKSMDLAEIEGTRQKKWEERYWIFAILALFFLLLDMLISERGRG